MSEIGLSQIGKTPQLRPRRGACEHLTWRAFLPAITGFGLHQPGRYAAFLFTRIHNFWV